MDNYENDYNQAMAEVRRLRRLVRNYISFLREIEKKVVDSINKFNTDKTETNAAAVCILEETLIDIFAYYHDCSGEQWVADIHKKASECGESQ